METYEKIGKKEKAAAICNMALSSYLPGDSAAHQKLSDEMTRLRPFLTNAPGRSRTSKSAHSVDGAVALSDMRGLQVPFRTKLQANFVTANFLISVTNGHKSNDAVFLSGGEELRGAIAALAAFKYPQSLRFSYPLSADCHGGRNHRRAASRAALGSREPRAFYRNFHGPVRVGIEATGPIHWFERLLTELGHELWMGDSAKIRASEVRKQKTDERDARLILDLLLAKRFPKIWVPTPAERDLRQLLWHRHKLVCLRTMLGNQLHALAIGPATRFAAAESW